MMRQPFQEIGNRVDKNDSERESFRLRQEVLMLTDLNGKFNSEISRLKMVITQIDNEKDQLLNTIDEKTVENVKLRKDVTNCTQMNENLNEQLAQMNAMINKASSQLETMSNELNTLKINSEYLKMENSQLKQTMDSHFNDARQLQDDLLTVTRENQVLHAELEKHNSDKTSLREQIQEYMHEVSKLHDVISNNDTESQNLKSQIVQMTNELNGIQHELSQSENQRFGLKMELQIKSLDAKRLRDKVESVEREFCKKVSECQEYEVKMSVSARNLQRSEDQLKKVKIEMKELMRDMVNFRDLNTRLEQVKDDVSRQLTKKDIDYDTLRNKFEDISAENELLKSHLNGERSMVKQLEELIASNREKDYKAQLNNHKSVSEVKLLKDRIALGEQKIHVLNKEIDRFKTKVAELEAENEILKRQLYNFKFDTVVKILKMENDDSSNSSACSQAS
ncbi:hypothetical protein BpHYR1_003147, partial [Brachionus plicatilis]